MMRMLPSLLALAAASLVAEGQRRGRRISRSVSRRPANAGHRTEPHPIRNQMREHRHANTMRNFATGHWQHRAIDAAAVQSCAKPT